MGSGSFSSSAYAEYSTSLGRSYDAHTGRVSGQSYEATNIDAALDPRKFNVRECANSEEHPNTIPVILALDVTGSMGEACHETAAALGVIMTDKVQKIKEEIERVEQILDDFNKTHNNTIDSGIVSAKKNICKHLKAFINSLPEEHNEDLEEEIEIYSNNVHFPICYDDYKRFARHFAEWQKQKMKEAFQTEYEKGRFDMREEMMKTLVEGDIVKDIHNQLSVKSEPIKDTFGNLKFGDKVKLTIIKDEHNTTTKD